MTQASNNPRSSARKRKVDIEEIVHELEDIERKRKSRRRGAIMYGGVAAGALLILASGAILATGNGGSIGGGKTLGQASATAKAPDANEPEIVAGFEADPPQSPLTDGPISVDVVVNPTTPADGITVTAVSSPSTGIARTVPSRANPTTGASTSGSEFAIVAAAGLPDGSNTAGDITVDLNLDTGGSNGGGGNGDPNSNGGNGNGGGSNGNGGSGGDNGATDGDNGSASNDPLLSVGVGGNTVSVGGDEGLLGVELNQDGAINGVLDGATDALNNVGLSNGDDGGLPGVSVDVGDGESDNLLGVDVGGSADNGLLGVDLGPSDSSSSTDGNLLDVNVGGLGVSVGAGPQTGASVEPEGLIEIDLGGLF